MQAADVMTFGAATISPDAPLEEAARLMLQHRISGLPVVNSGGALVGMVTEGDLLRQGAGGGAARPRWLEFLLGDDKSGGALGKVRRHTVGDVMTPDVVTAGPDTPVAEIADLMQLHGIKRVPVVENDKVMGIVARADLLRGLARDAERMRAASDEDRAIRDRVLDALGKDGEGGRRALNVTVRAGTVELRGAVADASLRDQLVAAARNVPGVRDVSDRLAVVPPKGA